MASMVKNEITAGAVGSFLAKQIGSAIVKKTTNQFIVPQLFDALGLSESDDAEKYAQMVMAEMRRLADNLGRQIEQVQDSVNRVAALTLKIDAYQQQEGLSQILRAFNAESTKIEELFDEFSNDVQGLSATDQNKSRTALKDLYVRLKAPNDTNVAVAMRNIHNLVVPPTAGDRGILDYLSDIVGQSVVNATPGFMKPVPYQKADWRKEYCLPGDVDYVPANQILKGAPTAVNKELQTVQSVFHRILAAQTKGLMVLSRAWSGNPQERSLQLHIDNIVAEIASMKAFFAKCVPQIVASIGKSIQQYGKALTGEITRLPWLDMRTWHNQNLWKDVPEGLNPKWIVWDVNATDQHGEVSADKPLYSAMVVEEPWMVGERRALDIAMSGFQGEAASYIRQSMAELRPIRYIGTEPDELVSMLKTLPATPKELKDAAEAAIGT